MKESNQAPIPQSDPAQIDLLSFFKTLWNGRKILIKVILICGIIGFFVAISSPNEYEAYTIMVPSSSSGSNIGGLGGLAALAGININSASGGELSPSVYPKIVASIPFLLELMNTPLNIKEIKNPVTFFEYYTKFQKPNLLYKYTIGLPGVLFGLPGTIISALKGEMPDNVALSEKQTPIALDPKRQGIINRLSGMITLNSLAKDGVLTLTAKMPEGLAAAQLAQAAQELLQKYIIEFKIKKAKTNLAFIQQRFDETKLQFEQVQLKLALFNDRNKNVTLATAKSAESSLTSEYNLIFSIYTELAKQLEQAKIQVKQDTPVFTIIEPVSIPTSRSKPNRPLIVFIWIFLGSILGTVILLGKIYTTPIIKHWNEI